MCGTKSEDKLLLSIHPAAASPTNAHLYLKKKTQSIIPFTQFFKLSTQKIPIATHIWNCGNLCAGNNNARSNSLAAASCNCNQCGCPCAWSPLLALTAHDESRADNSLMCELRTCVQMIFVADDRLDQQLTDEQSMKNLRSTMNLSPDNTIYPQSLINKSTADIVILPSNICIRAVM